MIKKIRLALSLISFLLIFVYCLAFASRNSADVAVNFLVGEPLVLPLALWFGFILALGCALGILVGAVTILARKRQIRRLEKQLADAQDRLGRLP
ncbi:LapA family protein [Oceanobacter mangrovi]|uniref:LapA family protein n=1 Tax=Oceanobacter mangrovi TaxID=2862510 RepID=UPI001C8E8A48|nr:LapA family protein [Oceanobacter mangrovi]